MDDDGEIQWRDKPDWRVSHEEQVDTYREQYFTWREENCQREARVVQTDKLKRICDLTDDEIHDLAVQEATVATEAAINVYKENQRHRRYRAGEAQ